MQVRLAAAFDLARARLARWIAPERKPPAHAPSPTPAAAPPEIPPANAAYLDRARGMMEINGWRAVAVCRGSRKGCTGARECPFCAWVYWHDKRPSAEILQAIERGDA